MKLQPKPSKRNEALVSFSQEHHFGLLLVWKIKQGMKHKVAPARIAEYALFFFEKGLREHFEAEETLLFPKLEKGSPLLQRALREHQSLYDLIAGICSDKQNSDLLCEFADTLDKHIRFEERILFNRLQNELSDAELVELAEKHPRVARDADEQWNDHFWKVR